MAQLIGIGVAVGIWLVTMAFWPEPKIKVKETITVDWPTFIEDVASNVRAGSALPNAVFSAGHRLPPSAAAAFSQAEAHWQTTGGFLTSLESLGQVFPEAGFQLFASTANLSFTQGGSSVPTVLSQLARSLRSRKQLANDVAARQATTVNSAKVAVVAPVLVLGLTGMREEVRAAYQSASGLLVLIAIFMLTASSYWLMVKTAKMPELDWIR